LIIAVANVADAAFRSRDRQQNQPIFGGTTETMTESIGRGGSRPVDLNRSVTRSVLPVLARHRKRVGGFSC